MMEKTPKRIVLIGASGVGKTSLLKKFKDGIALQIIDEQARIICKELGFKNIYEIKNPNHFRQLVLKKQIEIEEQLNEFISDRSTIDCWVHWVRWSYESAKTFESEKYYQKAFHQALKYSHIIYIPIMFEITKDDFRWTNNEYQNQIDRLVLNVLKDWGLMKRTYIVESPILNNRAKEVLNYLNDG